MKGITKHGNKRVKQRIKTKDVEKIAKIAFEKGLRQKDARGRLAKYLSAKSRDFLTEPVVYNENVFVYGKDKALVTTFPLPSRLRSSANSQQRRKEANDQQRTDPASSSHDDQGSGGGEPEGLEPE